MSVNELDVHVDVAVKDHVNVNVNVRVAGRRDASEAGRTRTAA
jgi:hypothetical protein